MTALLMLEGGSRQVLTRGEDVTFNIINLLRPWDDQSSGKLQEVGGENLVFGNHGRNSLCDIQ